MAELLVHPKPDIGPAGKKQRIRVFRVEPGETVECCRGEETPVTLAIGQIAIRPDRRQQGRTLLRRLMSGGTGAECGVDDRTIAGAATEIAGDRVVDLGAARLFPLKPKPIDRHHETGRAEAALRAMAINHRLLHGMQHAIGIAQTFDRDQLTPVQHGCEQNTGIDRAVMHAVRCQLADDDGAGTAIALGTAFLCTAAILDPAQIIENGFGRIAAIQRANLSIQDESNRLARHVSSRDRSYSHSATGSAAHGSARAPRPR
jgi:hypothetical protein